MAGASSCRVESFNYTGPSGEGYACRLMGRTDEVLTQGFDNHTCDNMMNKIRNLMIAGQFDHMCGRVVKLIFTMGLKVGQ